MLRLVVEAAKLSTTDLLFSVARAKSSLACADWPIIDRLDEPEVEVVESDDDTSDSSDSSDGETAKKLNGKAAPSDSESDSGSDSDSGSSDGSDSEEEAAPKKTAPKKAAPKKAAAPKTNGAKHAESDSDVEMLE